MSPSTVEERIKIIKTYYQNMILLYSRLGPYDRLRSTHTVNTYEETGSVTDIVRHVHQRHIRSTEYITVVAQCVETDPNMSVTRLTHHFGLSYDSLWQILCLHLHSYPTHSYPILKPQNNDLRMPPLFSRERTISRRSEILWKRRQISSA